MGKESRGRERETRSTSYFEKRECGRSEAHDSEEDNDESCSVENANSFR